MNQWIDEQKYKHDMKNNGIPGEKENKITGFDE